MSDAPLGLRCLACGKSKWTCSNVDKELRSKATPKKPAKGKMSEVVEEEDEDDVEDEDEVEGVDLQVTPPAKKSLFGTISSKLSTKCKNSDRSPQEAPPTTRQSVPRASSIYSQPMGPPISTSPSFSSFETPGAGGASSSRPRMGKHFEVERLEMLLNVSKEDLAISERQYGEDAETMGRRYRERERRLLADFEKECGLLKDHIAQLEEALSRREAREHDLMVGSSRSKEGASGSSQHRGSRRG
jgi:hypothetical protein